MTKPLAAERLGRGASQGHIPAWKQRRAWRFRRYSALSDLLPCVSALGPAGFGPASRKLGRSTSAPENAAERSIRA